MYNFIFPNHSILMHPLTPQISLRSLFSIQPYTSFQPKNPSRALFKCIRRIGQTDLMGWHLAAGAALVRHQSVCLIFQTCLAYFYPSPFPVSYYEEGSGFLIAYFASCTAHLIAHRLFHILLSVYIISCRATMIIISKCLYSC